MSTGLWSDGLGIIIAAAAGIGVATAAWRAGALSASGALGAALLGTLTFGLGGFGWAALLLGFFVSSSALSRLFRRKKARLEEKFSKGSRRDLAQVMANGGIAGIFVVLHAFYPAAAWPWAGFAGALAAATADTWATEIGVLSRSAPKTITTGRPVERGASGGVTPLGLLAALSGAAVIALLAVLFWRGRFIATLAGVPNWLENMLGAGMPALEPRLAAGGFVWITLAGLAGSLLDSVLGAALQAVFYCPVCQKETERYPLHTCGAPTHLVRGWRWLDNDWVNAFCTLAGGAAAVIGAVGWIL